MTQDEGGADLPPEHDPEAPAGSGERPWWGQPWGTTDPGQSSQGTAGASPEPPTGQPHPTQVIPLGQDAPPSLGASAPRDRGPLRATAVLLVAVVALLAGGAGAAIGVTVGRDHHADTTTTDTGQQVAAISPTIAAKPAGGETALEAVAAGVAPAVVLVTETFGAELGTGSGVVIDSARGYILTNNHVVSGFATAGGTLKVTTMAGRSAPATVVGRDPTADIAVIRVSLPGLTQARLGNSSTVAVGETVVAFGAPLGLQGTVTSGIVSALNRPVSTQDTTGSSNAPTQATIDAIQTDAAINPGNSGGALVDLSGSVIGINSAIASVSGAGGGQSTESGSIGVGFAIPIDEAKYTADQIIATGHAVHAVIGVSLRADSGDPASTGAVVRDVVAGGPAAKAGIQSGDVLVAVDGKAIADADAAIVAVRAGHKPGDVVQVTISRGGGQRTVSVTLGASAPS